jgi:hypothetical protein
VRRRGNSRRRVVARLGERPSCHLECDDREQDNCDLEDNHDAEGYCMEDHGETVMWGDDMESQEVLVTL